MITQDGLSNGRFVYFPDDSPPDIGASFTFTERRGSEVCLNCALCGVEYLVRVDDSNTVLPEYVKTLAAHLWRIHGLPCIGAAR